MSLPLIPIDKANHIVYGAVIFAAAYALFTFAGLPALPIAAGMVVIAAVAKEVWDRAHKETHTSDPLDALATIGGGALCSIPVIIGG